MFDSVFSSVRSLNGSASHHGSQYRDEIRAEKALVFYSDGHVSLHKIREHAGNFSLEAGRLVAEKSLGSIKRLLSSASSRQREMRAGGLTLLPKNIVAMNDDYLVWVCESRQRHYWYRGKSMGVVPYPHLLMVASRQGSLRVFGLDAANVVGESPLYHAPLMNVDDDGCVCVGTGTKVKSVSIESMTAWEDIIFETNFTHTNCDMTFDIGKDGIDDKAHLKTWRTLKNKKAFPVNLLKATRLTVQELIGSLR